VQARDRGSLPAAKDEINPSSGGSAARPRKSSTTSEDNNDGNDAAADDDWEARNSTRRASVDERPGDGFRGAVVRSGEEDAAARQAARSIWVG